MIFSKRKGISPLVATVLLIAFTISVGAIIGAWVTGFSKTESDELDNNVKNVLDCSGASITFDSEEILSNDIIVTNNGNLEFQSLMIIVQRQNGTDITIDQYNTDDVNVNNTLKVGETRLVGNDSMSIQSGDKVIVKSVQCPSMEHSKVK